MKYTIKLLESLLKSSDSSSENLFSSILNRYMAYDKDNNLFYAHTKNAVDEKEALKEIFFFAKEYRSTFLNKIASINKYCKDNKSTKIKQDLISYLLQACDYEVIPKGCFLKTLIPIANESLFNNLLKMLFFKTLTQESIIEHKKDFEEATEWVIKNTTLENDFSFFYKFLLTNNLTDFISSSLKYTNIGLYIPSLISLEKNWTDDFEKDILSKFEDYESAVANSFVCKAISLYETKSEDSYDYQSNSTRDLLSFIETPEAREYICLRPIFNPALVAAQLSEKIKSETRNTWRNETKKLQPVIKYLDELLGTHIYIPEGSNPTKIIVDLYKTKFGEVISNYYLGKYSQDELILHATTINQIEFLMAKYNISALEMLNKVEKDTLKMKLVEKTIGKM